jgi:hypothetical protein
MQKVTWEYSDPGAFPFSGSHEVIANGKGLFVKGMQSEKIEPEQGYSISSFAPWVYLKDAWQIPGDFSLLVINDRKQYETINGHPDRSRKSGVVHR